MKMKWMVHCLLITALAAPALGQVGIYIGQTPPPLRYEPRPPLPGEGFVWIDGYWGAQNGRWVWVPGRWERPPFPGAYWSHPHYDRYREGWRLHEGHWDHEDHDDHHDWGHRDRDHDGHH
jgi:WXXGXW repeat (2 copies)